MRCYAPSPAGQVAEHASQVSLEPVLKVTPLVQPPQALSALGVHAAAPEPLVPVPAAQAPVEQGSQVPSGSSL